MPRRVKNPPMAVRIQMVAVTIISLVVMVFLQSSADARQGGR